MISSVSSFNPHTKFPGMWLERDFHYSIKRKMYHYFLIAKEEEDRCLLLTVQKLDIDLGGSTSEVM